MKNKMFKIDNREKLLLLSKATNKSKEWLLAYPEYKPNFWEFLKYKYYLYKLNKGYPIAYILGHKEFFGLDFLTNKHTLIPRPDTEILVDETIKETFSIQSPLSNILLIDVGTGTGCIPIAILKRFKDSKDLKINVVATDISKETLKVAKKNAKKHNVKIDFLHGNLLSPIFKSLKSFESFKSIIITANLPYLKEEWWQKEPSIQHEPKLALVSDNKTGLYVYEKLLQQISENIAVFNSCNLVIFFEIDPRQSTQIFHIIHKHLPEASVEIIKDLSGFDRVVKIKIS